MGTGIDLAGNSLHDLDTRLFQRRHLIGIIRQQADLGNAESLQHLSGQGEVAVIGFEAEPFVGLDRIEPGILQFVSLQLGHQPDAAPFLLLVDQHPGAQFGDHGKRHLQLLTAIAAYRCENVAGEALGMDAYQRRRRGHVSHDQGDGFFLWPITPLPKRSFETVYAESSPAGGEISRGELSHGT